MFAFSPFGGAPLASGPMGSTIFADVNLIEQPDTANISINLFIKGDVVNFQEYDDVAVIFASLEVQVESLGYELPDQFISDGQLYINASIEVTNLDGFDSHATLDITSQFSQTELDDIAIVEADLFINGSLTFTVQEDGFVAAGNLPVQTYVQITEQDDSFLSDGQLFINGQAIPDEPADVLTIETRLYIVGHSHIAELDDYVITDVDLHIQATHASTIGLDTFSGEASLGIQATVEVSNGDDTLASTAQLYIAAVDLAPELPDGFTASSKLDIQATANFPDMDISDFKGRLAIQGSQVHGLVPMDTLVVSGNLDIQAHVDILEKADHSAALGDLPVTAEGSALESADSAAAEGMLRIRGNLHAIDFDGLITETHLLVQGSTNFHELPDGIAAAAEIGIHANVNAADIDSFTGHGALRIAGNITLEDLDGLNAFSSVKIASSLNALESADSLQGSASLILGASLVSIEALDVANFIGQLRVTANATLFDYDTVVTETRLEITGALDATETSDAFYGYASRDYAGTLVAVELPDSLFAEGMFGHRQLVKVVHLQGVINPSVEIDAVMKSEIQFLGRFR